VAQLPIVSDCYAEVDRLYPKTDPYRRRHEALRRVFGVMVTDLLERSRAILKELDPPDAQAIREAGRPVIAFSDSLRSDLGHIRKFLFQKMYRAPSVMEQRAKVTTALNELFPIYMADPALLPERWQGDVARAEGKASLARLVADYIAGMTDRYALQSHAALTGKDILGTLEETGLPPR
jgi:dGTPase